MRLFLTLAQHFSYFGFRNLELQHILIFWRGDPTEQPTTKGQRSMIKKYGLSAAMILALPDKP